MPHSIVPPPSRTGSVILVVVLGALVVLGILGFSLYRSMIEKSRFVNAHTISVLMDLAASEIAEVVFHAVGEDLQSPQGSLFQSLLTAAPTAFPFAVPDQTATWEQSFAYRSRKEFTGISPIIQVRFVNPQAMGTSTTWNDPWEKQMGLEVTVTMSYGRIGMRPMGKTYRFRRACRLHSLHAPVLSRFTLFVLEPEQTDEKNEGYNCFVNFICGSRSQASEILPIIFFNHPVFKQTDLTKSGYIFLGGSNEIQLHLTAGTDVDNGEFFHFFNINSSSCGTPVFTMKNLPGTTAFSSAVSISQTPKVNGQLGVQGVVFGFYALDKMNPPNSMNFQNSLEKYFSTSSARSMKSTALHLFGNLKNPSPTVVFGRVMRVFGQYTYLTADLDGDGKYECRWSILRAPADYQTTSGSSASLWDLVRLPKSITEKKSKKNIELDDSLDLRSIFMTPNQYMDCASRLVMEEYNLSYEYLMDDAGTVPPTIRYKTRTGTDPLRTGDSVTIKRSTDGIELFNGNLNRVKLEDVISGRISKQYAKAADFLSGCISASELDLKGMIVYVGEAVQLPASLKVKNSGMIVANGNITVTGDVTADTGALLTLVAAKNGSSILLAGSNQDVHAHLVALTGTVKPTTQSNRPKIKGGLAVKSLIPQDWPVGAEITYDPERDPTLGNPEGYTFILADFYDEWSVRKR